VTGKHLVILEDDRRLRETMALEFADRGYVVDQAASLAELDAALAARPVPYDFALVDLRLGAESGLEAVAHLTGQHAACRVVVLTGYGSIATAVRAVRLGAVDYLTKPVRVAQVEQAFLADPERPAPPPPAAAPEPLSLARQEREYIERILDECGGNISAAARQLGLHRQSLQRKLRKFPPRR